MDDNQSKNIIPKKSDGRLSKASDLTKRGLHLAKNPTSVQHSGLSHFLDSVGGIPDNNLDVRFQEINKTLINYFSKMTVDEISRELEIEFKKRPNGRTLKLLGFSYFHGGNIDNAIRALTDCLKITSEDPVAIYELLGRCYVLKSDRENARRWFADSYRYDYEFFLEVFGWDFLYVTAVGRYRTRPPIFGEAANTFGIRALEIEIMADALSMCYGNKKGRKSLASAHVESVVSEMVSEYTKDSLKAIEDTKIIKDVVSQLLRESNLSDTFISRPEAAKNSTHSRKRTPQSLDGLSKNISEKNDAFPWNLDIQNIVDFEKGFFVETTIFPDKGGKLFVAQVKDGQKSSAILPREIADRIMLKAVYSNGVIHTLGDHNDFNNLNIIDHIYDEVNSRQSFWNNIQDAMKLLRIADDYEAKGCYEDAKKEYRQALSICRLPIIYCNLGYLLNKLGRFTESENLLWKALYSPNIIAVTMRDYGVKYPRRSYFHVFATAYINLSVSLVQQGKLQAAEDVLYKSITIDPKNVHAYTQLSDILLNQNRQKEAESVYHRAINENPNDAIAYFNLGTLLVKQNRIEEADSLLAIALQIDPSLERFWK